MVSGLAAAATAGAPAASRLLASPAPASSAERRAPVRFISFPLKTRATTGLAALPDGSRQTTFRLRRAQGMSPPWPPGEAPRSAMDTKSDRLATQSSGGGWAGAGGSVAGLRDHRH